MLATILWTFLVVLFGYWVYKLAKFIHFVYFYQLPLVKDFAGPECLPIIGCIHKMPLDIKEVPDYMMKWGAEAVEKNASLMKFMIGPLIVVMPVDHEAVKGILESNEITKGSDYSFFEKWLGKGLLLGDGVRWRKARKMATPAFHFNKLEEYSQPIEYHSRARFKQYFTQKKRAKEINLYNRIKLCALDIISDTTMGVPINAQQNENHPYVQAVEGFNTLAGSRSFKFYLKPDIVWKLLGYAKEEQRHLKVLNSFTEKVIKERMEVYNEQRDVSEGQKPNFLDIMLQAKDSEQMNEQHLREEVNTILFAGHDTTAHSICWAIWAFATHPDIQQRAYNELIEHFGESDSGFGSKQLKELKYFDQCVKEVLRMFPSAGAILRQLNNEIKMCGKTIPSGVAITIPIMLIHRNPRVHFSLKFLKASTVVQVFNDPDKFDPDRFAEGKEYPNMSYIPFSAGIRNCLGQKFALMEIKITLAHLLYNFEFSTNHAFEDNKISFVALSRPSLGVPVRLTKREH
ncbi:hypothetical protein M3Y97_00752100 [Aphelenchoides bicaudatus]|nr:hypothetical protein M3Y97_00752100 [Aphelenchoides bicaudatus]